MKSAKRCAGQKGFAALSAFPFDRGSKVKGAVERFHLARSMAVSLQPLRAAVATDARVDLTEDE